MPAYPLPRDLHRALDRLQAEPDRSWTLAHLAGVCGVAPRTLQKHFRRFLGRTPVAFIRELRLDHARQQLLRPAATTSVTNVAARFGFNHVGRFAAWYLRRYGESPSATLRRCQGALAGRTPSLPMLSLAVERPGIAVLPFTASGPHAGPQAGLPAGLSDEIAAVLCRLRWIHVTAPYSARYHLRGRVASDARGFLRVTALLIDVAAQRLIWADNWSGDCNDLLAFEERLAAGIGRALAPILRDAEINRACRAQPAAPNAWELTMRALPQVLSLEAAAEGVALELLEQAMELAPQDALPMSVAAWCHGLRAGHHFTSRCTEEKEAARRLAARAAGLGMGDPLAETMLASGYTLAHDLAAAEVHVERALTLDGGSAWAWGRRGWIKAYRGETAQAIECFQIARELAPLDRLHFLCCHGIASSLFDAGRYESSIGWFDRALAENPAATWINRWLIPAYVLAGRREEGRHIFGKLIQTSPDLTITDLRSGLPWHFGYLDRVAEGLKTAGMRV
jgi:AraC-like DNA-binding protein/tetratricopeptide (TPR) repeat protein